MMDHFFLGFGDELCKLASRKQIAKALIRRTKTAPKASKAEQELLKRKKDREKWHELKARKELKKRDKKAARSARRGIVAGAAGTMALGAKAGGKAGKALGHETAGKVVGTAASLPAVPYTAIGGAELAALVPVMLAKKRIAHHIARAGKKGKDLKRWERAGEWRRDTF